MTTDPQHARPEPPSLASLGRTVAASLAVAALLLVALVLPAEYGIDPLGTGRRLGLTAIAAPPVTTVPVTRVTGAPLTPTPAGPMATYPDTFRYDVFEIELEPFDAVEYKYQLEAGASMVFSWTATAPVVHDFHGQRTAPSDSTVAEASYDRQDRQGADGTFTAPFAGIHGWYWENPNADPVTIRLRTSGFYAAAMVLRDGRVQSTRPLRTPESWSADPARATARP